MYFDINEIRQLMRNHQYIEAKRIIEFQLNNNPELSIKYKSIFNLYLGKIAVSQKKYKKAEEQFKKCVEINKDRSPHAHLELGRLYMIQRKYIEAEKEFEKYIEIDKERSPHARLELGYLYQLLSKREEAIKQYRHIKKYNYYCQISEEETRIHIENHMNFNAKKEKHGIFIFEPTLESLKKLLHLYENLKQNNYMSKVYHIPYPTSGYRYDEFGNIIVLDYLTIIVAAFTNNIITAFPSNGNDDFSIIEEEVCKTLKKQ